MTTKLEDAFPLAANWVAANVRSKLAQCGIYLSSTAALSGEDFTIQPWAAVAVYGNNGALELYAYDAADTTTADDAGVSCIVVSGRRYKKRIDQILRGAALSATTSAQPASPTLGDTYVLPAAPSGTDWASQAKALATFTARGWIFRQPYVGMTVYVTDEAGFRLYDATGTWVKGLGAGGLADGSVAPKKLTRPFQLLKAEDQRNAPPVGTPTVGTCYQVGTSPTGAFAGQANAVARWNEAAAWEFFTPDTEDLIIRKDVAQPYSWRGGLWVPTVPASGVQQVKRKASWTALNNIGTTIVRDAGVTITSTVGKYLRFTFNDMSVAFGALGSANEHVLRLYADTSTTAIVQVGTTTSTASSGSFTLSPVSFIYAVPDGSAHNYNLGAVRIGGSSTRNFTITGTWLVEEIGLS